MSASNARSDAFFKAVNDASREEQSALLAETENYKVQAIRDAAVAAQQKYDEYIALATADFAAQDGIEAEKKAEELKRNALSVRNEITEKVFHSVVGMLRDFTLSEGYALFLKKSAEQMVKICGEAPVTIFLREADSLFTDKIKSVSPTVSVKTDNAIEIGGIYGVCEEKRLKLNDLLETRLAAQKDWFYENSGLSFKSLR